jgi:hypothetical protein
MDLGADIEDTVFNLAMTQPGRGRTLTVEGCRQTSAAARVGQSLACPFDLHILLPMPDYILQLGPIHPTALGV